MPFYITLILFFAWPCFIKKISRKFVKMTRSMLILEVNFQVFSVLDFENLPVCIIGLIQRYWHVQKNQNEENASKYRKKVIVSNYARISYGSGKDK